jgi:hypothetical protein
MTGPARSKDPCARCSATSRGDVWSALAPVQTLTEDEVSHHVTAWPDGRAVEVRACVECGRKVARLSASLLTPLPLL